MPGRTRLFHFNAQRPLVIKPSMADNKSSNGGCSALAGTARRRPQQWRANCESGNARGTPWLRGGSPWL
eukprot:6311830-Lingulodinium_polyedra.AAC.1